MVPRAVILLGARWSDGWGISHLPFEMIGLVLRVFVTTLS